MTDRDPFLQAAGEALIDREDMDTDTIWSWIDAHADDSRWWSFLDELQTAIATTYGLEYNFTAQRYQEPTP